MSMTTENAAHAEMVPDWEQPDDAQKTWMQDRMHFPYPITRMEDDLARLGLLDGFNRAHELYDIPARMQARRFWTYHYASMAPLALSPEEMQAMAARSEEKVGAVLGALEETWQSEWLPAIMRHIDHFQRFKLDSASDAELLQHLEDAIERIGDLWLLHFRIVLPSYLAMNLFEEFYRDLFSDESAFRPYKLIQGIDNKTVESGTALWKLSRKAAGSSTIRDIFVFNPPHGVIPALESSVEGNDFLIGFHEFLNEFGKRGETWGLNYPTWVEDPTPVIKTIVDYMNNARHDPERDQQALAE
jgi:hypothetical protein